MPINRKFLALAFLALVAIFSTVALVAYGVAWMEWRIFAHMNNSGL